MVKMKLMRGWAGESGIRERLALLAQFGTDFDPGNWGYHPSRDHWYYCGPREDLTIHSRGILNVKQEGTRSLELIAERWNIDRATAMALIGHPDKR
jgi:hypothetical protein